MISANADACACAAVFLPRTRSEIDNCSISNSVPQSIGIGSHRGTMREAVVWEGM